MQLIKDLSPPCFSIGERELETREMPSVSRSFSRSRSVLARSMAPLFLPFSIRPKITNSNSFHPLARSLAHRLRPSRPSYEALRRIRAAGPVAMEERAHLVARACKDDDDRSGSTQAGAAKRAGGCPNRIKIGGTAPDSQELSLDAT